MSEWANWSAHSDTQLQVAAARQLLQLRQDVGPDGGPFHSLAHGMPTRSVAEWHVHPEAACGDQGGNRRCGEVKDFVEVPPLGHEHRQGEQAPEVGQLLAKGQLDI